MTRADMDEVRSDFVRATRMSDQAGFDLLEVHMAHGYLLASFISPLTNRRGDAYGGSLGQPDAISAGDHERGTRRVAAGQAAVGQDLGGGLGAGGARRRRTR